MIKLCIRKYIIDKENTIVIRLYTTNNKAVKTLKET